MKAINSYSQKSDLKEQTITIKLNDKEEMFNVSIDYLVNNLINESIVEDDLIKTEEQKRRLEIDHINNLLFKSPIGHY